MENNSLLLTKAEALTRLPFGRRSLEGLISKGEIGFKKVGGRYYFLSSDIDRWANQLEYHTSYIPEETPTGRTLLSKPKMANASGIEALAAQMILEKQNNSVMRKLQAYKPKAEKQPKVSFQA